MVINTYGVYSEVELIEPTVVVTAKFNKVCIRSFDIYGCNNDFALFVVELITYGAYSEVELIEPTVVVIAKFNKARIRSFDKYRRNNGFALFVLEEIVSENPYGVVKGVGKAGV